MAIGIIFGILILAAVIGFFGWAGYAADNDNNGQCATGVILGILALIMFVIVPFSWHTVQTGQVAVVKQLGKAKYERTAGTYFDLWITNKYQKYDAKVQNAIIDTAAYSSDAQTMTLNMSVQYQIKTNKVMDIANQYGKLDALNDRIVAVATEKTKAVLSSYKAMDIIANRSSMSPEVEEAVRSAVGDEYYIDIVSVVLTNIDFSDAFEKAVEEKMIAEQQQLKADYENKTKVAKAQADADAKLIEAKATAEANKLLEKSLTDKILQELYITKWNGILPQVVGDGEMIFQLPENGDGK